MSERGPGQAGDESDAARETEIGQMRLSGDNMTVHFHAPGARLDSSMDLRFKVLLSGLVFSFVNTVLGVIIIAIPFWISGRVDGASSVLSVVLLAFLCVMTSIFNVKVFAFHRKLVAEDRRREARGSSSETLLSRRVGSFRDLSDRARRAGHPLLASEIDSAISAAYRDLPAILVGGVPPTAPRGGEERSRRAAEWLDEYPVARFEGRVRRAGIAYRLNLPLWRESAVNFAAAEMADRLESVESVILPRLTAIGAQGSRGWSDA
jgi:hypothetical protein